MIYRYVNKPYFYHLRRITSQETVIYRHSPAQRAKGFTAVKRALENFDLGIIIISENVISVFSEATESDTDLSVLSQSSLSKKV